MIIFNYYYLRRMTLSIEIRWADEVTKNLKIPQSTKRGSLIFIEDSEEIQKKLAIFEESVKKNKEAKEKELQKQKLYAKNRADIHERMRKIKEFIKQNKEDNKINEDFYEKNKDYFKQFVVKNYS